MSQHGRFLIGNPKEKNPRIAAIEKRLELAKHLLAAFIPLHMVIDRKVFGLKNEIKTLENERLELQQGQLRMFDENF